MELLMAQAFHLITHVAAIADYRGTGYLAGTGDGIVTVAGQSAQRTILCYRADNHEFVCYGESLKNGHWLIPALDPRYRYRIIAVDGDYHPVAWDNLTPATDLTIAEQQVLWEQMQNL